MLRDLRYLLAYLPPATAYLAVTQLGLWSFSTVIFTFGLVPLYEQFSEGTTKNLTGGEEEKKAASSLFDLMLYLNLPLLLYLLWLYLSAVTSGRLVWWEVFGITLSMGIIMGSIGINVAHELGHRKKKYEQFMAKVLLTTTLYNHFNIEHNRGHHLWVSTPRDPASAKSGEGLYAFWLRSITGGYTGAWQLENDRLRKAGRPFFSAANEMILFQLAHLAYLFGIWWLFGWTGVGFAILVALIGVLELETVNYIEHFGLRRKKLDSGFYEKVSPRHSWNSNHDMGRILLYELTRHSDHHFKATRKYQTLRHFDQSPQLPHGYPASMLIALVPPLWFGIMNPKVKKLEEM